MYATITATVTIVPTYWVLWMAPLRLLASTTTSGVKVQFRTLVRTGLLQNRTLGPVQSLVRGVEPIPRSSSGFSWREVLKNHVECIQTQFEPPSVKLHSHSIQDANRSGEVCQQVIVSHSHVPQNVHCIHDFTPPFFLCSKSSSHFPQCTMHDAGPLCCLHMIVLHSVKTPNTAN